MNTTWKHRALAGLAGGLAFAVVNFLTFGLLSGSRVGHHADSCVKTKGKQISRDATPMSSIHRISKTRKMQD